MRFAITYGRKVRTKAYDMLEISFYQEFDERTDPEQAFESVKTRVEAWIEKECDRILEKSVRRPESEGT